MRNSKHPTREETMRDLRYRLAFVAAMLGSLIIYSGVT